MTLLVADLENQLPMVFGAARDPLSTNRARTEPWGGQSGGN